jgi:hypothetical protein
MKNFGRDGFGRGSIGRDRSPSGPLLSVIDRSGRIGQTFRISEKASRKSPEEEKRLSPVQITQMPSEELVPKKSQMASGQSQNTLPEPSVQISQTPSAKFAATFFVKKRLIEWAEAAQQSKSGER